MLKFLMGVAKFFASKFGWLFPHTESEWLSVTVNIVARAWSRDDAKLYIIALLIAIWVYLTFIKRLNGE